MWKKLTNDVGLKVLALLFAIIIWLVVVNVEDPDITRSFTVQVSFENENVLDDAGMMYQVLNASDTIRVTISASRSIVENLTASDFSATVDFNDLNTETLEGDWSLPVYVSSNRYTNRVSVVSSTKYVELFIEEEKAASLKIAAVMSGTPADGYAVGNVSIYPQMVTVSGPASVIDTISQAVASVDVAGMYDDVTEDVTPVLYDADGNVIDTAQLTSKIGTVGVSVSCYEVKEVELAFETSGTPADGYEVGVVTPSTETVLVKGSEQALKSLSQITITDDALDVSNADSNLTKTIDLKEYLPYGVYLVDEDDAEVDVEISIMEYAEVTLSIPTSSITLTDLDDSLSATFADDTVDVTVICPSVMRNQITENMINLEAVLTDYSAGTYNVTLKTTLADLVRLKSNVTTRITLEENDS